MSVLTLICIAVSVLTLSGIAVSVLTLSSIAVFVLTQMVVNGGPELLDELCLATHCPLGTCITTRGYLLPVPAHSKSMELAYLQFELACNLAFLHIPRSSVVYCPGPPMLCLLTGGYHCVFGSIQEDLQQCIWHALDNGCSETVATIAF